MGTRMFKPLACLMAFVLLVGLACSLTGGTDQPTAVPVEATVDTKPVEVEPTQAPEPTEVPEETGAVTTREDAEKAIVRIVAYGDYVYPDDTSGGAVYDLAGSGSGFIVSPEGIAITNNHVVTGANYLEVYFSGEDKAYDARILGVSECSDLAVIDIEGEGYEFLEWYDGSLDVGMTVWSAGYPLGDPEYSLHRGVISKRNKSLDTDWASVENVVEHDATINPGNSGGPLLTDDGKVVGVNYASSTQAVNQFSAIGPVEAGPILDDLMENQDVNSIGVNGSSFVSEDGSFSGIWVYSVDTNSPAYEAGVRGGDILTQLEGNLLGADGTMAEYCKILKGRDATDRMSLEVLRLSTGEMLAGELNGDELAYSYDFTGGSGEPGGEDTTSTDEAFHLEDFDSSLDEWSYWLFQGDESYFDIYTDSGRLVFEENDDNIWAYLTYDSWIYEDVRLDVEAENLGRNNNNVSLICRYSEEDGWYEFNIANNGMWWILRYDPGINEYVELYSGGSNLINMGQDTNTYTAICKGDRLTLGINGVEVKSISDRNLKEGLIGLSVSSFDVVPIEVAFEYIDISFPE